MSVLEKDTELFAPVGELYNISAYIERADMTRIPKEELEDDIRCLTIRSYAHTIIDDLSGLGTGFINPQYMRQFIEPYIKKDAEYMVEVTPRGGSTAIIISRPGGRSYSNTIIKIMLHKKEKWGA